MTTASSPTPIRSVEQLVGDLLDVQQQINDLSTRATSIRNQLATQVGVGNEHKVGDVSVSVREPNRRFNTTKALTMLTDEQRALCHTALDVKKVRDFLPPVLAEQCMDAGTGSPIVSVR